MSEADRRTARLLARSHDDPDFFNRVILRRPDYWAGRDGYAGQREWCRSVARYRCTAIETGNMLGKDFWVGGLVPWWLWTRPNSLVVVTGPGQTILGSVTWKEIRKAIEGSPFRMGASISKGIKTSPHTVTLGTGWQALGYSTTSVERASGQHNRELLVVVEEASGVEDDAWGAIDSLGFTKLVAIGNPLKPDGGFRRLCLQALKHAKLGLRPFEATIHHNVPSWAGPHAGLAKSPVGLADKTWLDACAREHGKDSLWYRTHVDAVCPTETDERLIAEELLDRAAADAIRAEVARLRLPPHNMGGNRYLACDVGEGVGKSRTVVVVRDDLGVLEIHSSPFVDATDAAKVMFRLHQKWAVPPKHCSFDASGTTGAKLRNALEGVGLKKAQGYFGNDKGGRYAVNLRSGCALALAKRLDPKTFVGSNRAQPPFSIPMSPEWAAMREELLALRYHLVGDRYALELKADMMLRLQRSPDYADALAQTYRLEVLEG